MPSRGLQCTTKARPLVANSKSPRGPRQGATEREEQREASSRTLRRCKASTIMASTARANARLCAVLGCRYRSSTSPAIEVDQSQQRAQGAEGDQARRKATRAAKAGGKAQQGGPEKTGPPTAGVWHRRGQRPTRRRAGVGAPDLLNIIGQYYDRASTIYGDYIK